MAKIQHAGKISRFGALSIGRNKCLWQLKKWGRPKICRNFGWGVQLRKPSTHHVHRVCRRDSTWRVEGATPVHMVCITYSRVLMREKVCQGVQVCSSVCKCEVA